MKLDLNKDFETQFKIEAWKGFTRGEIACGVVALILAGIVVLSVWHVTGLPINVCVYFGVPVMVPVVALGMIKYQGHNLLKTYKEVRYFMKTRELCVEMEEKNQKYHRVFAMKRKQIKSKAANKKRRS